jgi:hypothetical protein
MLTQQNLIISLAIVLLTVPASAGPLVCVITQNQQFGTQQFGTVDLGTGAFHQIGPYAPEGESGLVAGPNGSLLTLTYSGNLDSINPATGSTSVIGATGLAGCTPPASPCAPNAANTLGELSGRNFMQPISPIIYTPSIH